MQNCLNWTSWSLYTKIAKTQPYLGTGSDAKLGQPVPQAINQYTKC